ncbi:alpha/beta hydrolase [Ruegeria sediminis]|uniref:Alpha/beta hydrolase n=1 Tax=Ruegeria sediminis TaxID=2583820 RepID=A0ABY2WWE3_9RHOB|nr:alpha/beta hydrolase [Ruegeria sediminis]TMV07075.1 alpha/beta hydrolase [Ruegeria sediminis]
MLYRGFSSDELAREYSPSSMVGGDNSPYLAAYAALSAKVRTDLQVQENLSYGNGPTHVLDYFPGREPDAPLHVFIHGGYWQALSQRESAMMAPALVEGGHAFATLNYTIAPNARLGEMVVECRDALMWLGSQAGTMGFDPARVSLSGHSAGGHLAAMVMATAGSDLAGAGLQVSDVTLISGVFDLEPISLVPVNDPLQLTQQEIEDLSPIHHLPPTGPQYRVTAGGRDTGEFIRQSRDYAERLRKAGHSVSFDLQQGVNHFDIILHAGTFRTPLG